MNIKKEEQSVFDRMIIAYAEQGKLAENVSYCPFA